MNIRLTLICVLIVVILYGCEVPSGFKGFEWDIKLNVPLMNRTYPIYDLEDGENFIVEDSLLVLFYNNSMESDEAAENLKLRKKSSRVHHIYSSAEGTIVSVPIDESGIDDEDIEVTYAHISKGTIQIELTETIKELHQLTIVFTDIITPAGEPLVTVIEGFTDSLYYEDISNCFIGSLDSEVVIDSLNFLVTSVNDDTDDKLTSVRIFFDDPLYFDYFRGYLTNKRVRIEDQRFESGVNYPYNISNAIKLQEAALNLSFLNELGFDARFTGDIVAKNYKDGKESVMKIREEDNVIFHRAVSEEEAYETNTGIERDELVDFLNVYPEDLFLRDAQLIIGNTDNSIGFAYASNKNYGTFELLTPSIFTVNNSTIIPDSIYVVEISEENRNYIEKYPQRVELSFTLENTTPLGATVDIFMGSSPDTLHLFQHELPDTLDIHTLLFADNYVGQRVSPTQPGRYEVEFIMEREDIELFLREEVYYAIKITFDASGQPVTIHPDHHIKILGKLTIKVRMDV